MQRCSLSISLGGYNTVMELLSSGSQGLVYAAEPNGDNEQMLRIRSLVSRGILRELPGESLASGQLTSLIAEALAHPLKTIEVRTDGAQISASVLSELQRLEMVEASQRRPRRDENSFSSISRSYEPNLERTVKCA